MPLRYDTEEELEELRSRRSRTGAGRAAGSDTEIALGTRSLLAIFFGLVLVCAIFFGLGYSVGRGTTTRAADQPATQPASTPADSHLSKPSPDQTLTPVETPASEASDSSTPNAESPSAPQPGSAEAPATARAATPPAATPVPAATVPAAKSATLQPAVATTAANFMVQVAAVRVPQDAQILVEALKKHGYAAVVRNEPQDQLLHIQLGPYASRPEAMAMRTKLLGDGYNAVVK